MEEMNEMIKKNIDELTKEENEQLISTPIMKLNRKDKKIRTNPKYAVKTINKKQTQKTDDLICSLTVETNEISNSLFLTKYNNDKTILEFLLEKYNFFFKENSNHFEKRVKESPEMLEIIINYLKKYEKLSQLSYPFPSELCNMTILNKLIKNNMFNVFHAIIRNNRKILYQKNEQGESLLDILYNSQEFRTFYSLNRGKLDYDFVKIYDNYTISIVGKVIASLLVLSSIKSGIESQIFDLLYSNKSINNDILLYKWNSKSTILEDLYLKFPLTTLNYVKDNGLYDNEKIKILLEISGINLEKNFNTKRMVQVSEIREKNSKSMINSDLSIGLTESQQTLLNEFKMLFLEDNMSSSEIINLAYSSFEQLFLKNYKYAERDLITLINIKKDNPNFKMIRSDDTYFSPDYNLIAIENIYNIDHFNHELAHAIHYYCANYEIPEQFLNLDIKINQSKLDEFVNFFSKEEDKFHNNYIDYNYYEKDFKESKNESKELEYTFSNTIVRYIKSNIIDEEKFKKYYNKISLREKFYQNANSWIQIFGFIDSLKKGEIFEKGIETVYHTTYIGHSKEYFKDEKKIFLEIYALYIEIIKSNYFNEQNYNFLKEIVGEEVLDMLDRFNQKMGYGLIETEKGK